MGGVASARSSCGPTSSAVGDSSKCRAGTGLVSVSVIFLLLVGVFFSFTLTSCRTTVVNLRQQNAAIVLRNFRVRPLAVANNGNTELALHDCIRLALANSLDLQTALWDERVKWGKAKSSRVHMLPSLKGEYELGMRDRPAWSRSDAINQEGRFEVIGPGPGTGVTNWSTSRARVARKWQVEMKWSPMDAAIARYNSRVKAYEAGYSRYQRTRVAQELLGAVDAAFHRLLALMRSLPKARALVQNRRQIVADLKSLAERALVENKEYLAEKDLLAENEQELADIYADIGRQREILAATMNVSPDTTMRIAGRLLPLPPHNLDTRVLEPMALVNRPEAYQADVVHLKSIDEHKRQLVKLLPKADGFIGYYRDENKFLLNKNWIDGGLKVTWDLIQFTADLLESAATRDKVVLTDRERSLISIGIISEVRLNTLKAIKAMHEFRKASKLRDQARERVRIARDVEDVKQRKALRARIVQIERQKAQCQLLETELDRLTALGEVRAALADLDSTVGSNYPIEMANVIPPNRSLVSALRRPIGLLRGAGRFARSFIPW